MENLENKPERNQDPERLLEEFYDIFDADGGVHLSEPGEIKEPASLKYQVKQLARNLTWIHTHERISEEDKLETGRRFMQAQHYLDRILSA